MAVALVVFTLAGCASGTGTPGASSGESGKHTATTPLVPQSTSPVVNTPAAEEGYKNSAEIVTIGQLVNGRINAPTFSIGTIVTFGGTVQRLLHYRSGQVSGLVLEDSMSDVICIRLSARASSAAGQMSLLINPMDEVTVWGTWQASASVDNYPSGSMSCSGVVDEMFLSDSTTGTSDGVT